MEKIFVVILLSSLSLFYVSCAFAHHPKVEMEELKEEDFNRESLEAEKEYFLVIRPVGSNHYDVTDPSHELFMKVTQGKYILGESEEFELTERRYDITNYIKVDGDYGELRQVESKLAKKYVYAIPERKVAQALSESQKEKRMIKMMALLERHELVEEEIENYMEIEKKPRGLSKAQKSLYRGAKNLIKKIKKDMLNVNNIREPQDLVVNFMDRDSAFMYPLELMGEALNKGYSTLAGDDFLYKFSIDLDMIPKGKMKKFFGRKDSSWAERDITIVEAGFLSKEQLNKLRQSMNMKEVAANLNEINKIIEMPVIESTCVK